MRGGPAYQAKYKAARVRAPYSAPLAEQVWSNIDYQREQERNAKEDKALVEAAPVSEGGEGRGEGEEQRGIAQDGEGEQESTSMRVDEGEPFPSLIDLS
jgi:hypothetical protein